MNLMNVLQVLGLLWNLAHSEDVPTEIMDQALSAHIKILDYSCSQVSIWIGYQFWWYLRGGLFDI